MNRTHVHALDPNDWPLGRGDGARRADALGGVRLGLHVGEQRLQLGPVQGLLLEQLRRDAVEGAPVLGDEPDGLRVGLIRQARLLVVAEALRLLGQRVVVGPQRARGHLVAHAVLEDHRPRDRRHALEVVRGSVRDRAEDDLLRRPPSEEHLHAVDQLLLGREEPVLLRRVQRVPEREAAGDDRHLLHRLGLADEV